jgi:dTDP-4-dehydrorhamnose 3,5-epimerase
MTLEPGPFAGLWIVRETPSRDERGAFVRLLSTHACEKAGVRFQPCQLSVSVNDRARTLRGMHWQEGPAAEGKFVRVLRGGIHDVVVDLRPGSRTQGDWFGIDLDATSRTALLLPPGVAHGFLTLADATEVLYAMDQPYEPASARGARWNDPAFAIQWPAQPVIVSERDRAWPDYCASPRA